MARVAVETLAKQNISLAGELQQLQAQQRGEAAKQEQWQMASDALMASLQLDIGHLRQQISDVGASCRWAHQGCCCCDDGGAGPRCPGQRAVTSRPTLMLVLM